MAVGLEHPSLVMEIPFGGLNELAGPKGIAPGELAATLNAVSRGGRLGIRPGYVLAMGGGNAGPRDITDVTIPVAAIDDDAYLKTESDDTRTWYDTASVLQAGSLDISDGETVPIPADDDDASRNLADGSPSWHWDEVHIDAGSIFQV